MSAATHPSSSLAPSPNTTMGSIDALSNGMHTDEPVELILLGTGTSSTLPHVDCLTRPPTAKQCKACTATLRPDGRKNKRVSALYLAVGASSLTPDLICVR